MTDNHLSIQSISYNQWDGLPESIKISPEIHSSDCTVSVSKNNAFSMLILSPRSLHRIQWPWQSVSDLPPAHPLHHSFHGYRISTCYLFICLFIYFEWAISEVLIWVVSSQIFILVLFLDKYTYIKIYIKSI